MAGAAATRSCGEPFGHAPPDPLGDGEFVSLVPHLIKLLDQLFFEFVQFRAARGDPFRDHGLHHEVESKWRRGRGAEETAKSPQTPSQMMKTADSCSRPA